MYKHFFKRLFDFIVSLIGAIVLLPFFILIAIIIFIDDPGPVFFRQKRVGKNKKLFWLWKFRTMKTKTPDIPTHLLEHPEQYITRFGRIARKLSIDELPQIWQILTGKMSIIGPRPALWNQDDLIAERDKYGANDIKPGLTGWAQINGRDELEIPVKAALDGEYVKKMSFAFDCKCFFGTIKAVFKHDGVVEGGTGELHKQNASSNIDYKAEYENWCSNPCFDENTRNELKALTDEKEIEDRFYKQLSFGTGGLRGIIGAGTNRMNIYTVGKATQGLANFINSQTKDGSAVIAYDSRIMSKEFALDSALVLCANGIKTYLFDTLHATPQLSFAVRYLKATAGIVITASHNPPQYNGYKAYWSDGAQVVSPYDKLIIDEVNKITDYADIKRISESQAKESGLLTYVGEDIDDAYIAELKKLVLNPDAIKQVAKDIKIVYTPLNGTGLVPVTRILKELGFESVSVVAEQAQPDGNFPTLKYPNPEDRNAFELALKLAQKEKADIVLATDPDADRLGVYAYDAKSGEYKAFTGNMSGLLIAEYELSQKSKLGLLPDNRKNAALITTVVSSNMAYDIADEYGLTVKEVLTGFKYIGEQINLFEKAQEDNNGELDCDKNALEFEFGYEESYGCLVGTHARDKDAIVAVMALCEATAYYKSKGISLWEQMLNIYEKYGYYIEDLQSITLSGVDGANKIVDMMKQLRENPPKQLGDFNVIAVRDYFTRKRTDVNSGEVSDIDLPQSNVLYFELNDNSWCCVRPSGTEPKIKIYFGVKSDSIEKSQSLLSKVKEDLMKTIGC